MINRKVRALLRPSNVAQLLRPASSPRFPDVIGTFMGRDALALAISVLNLSPDDTVLLPAYLCGEVLRPFVGKTRVEFYDVNSDLSVDPDTLRPKLNGRVKVVLIINYFGFLQPHRQEIRRLSEAIGAVMIEDCAHSLLTEGAGSAGHMSIFSYRKLLPVPDGGGLLVNCSGKTVAPDFYPAAYSAALSTLVVFRSLFDFKTNLLSRAWFASKSSSAGAPTTPKLVAAQRRTLPLSFFTANGLANLAFSEFIRERREDYEFWRGLIGQNGEVNPAFNGLPVGVCPLGFPVKVQDRDAFRNRLATRGIATTVEWRLPDRVGSEFVRSHELSRRMVTLPLSPMLGQTERQRARDFFGA